MSEVNAKNKGNVVGSSCSKNSKSVKVKKKPGRRPKQPEPEYPAEPRVVQIISKPKTYMNHSYRDFSCVPPELDHEEPERIEDMTFSQKVHHILSQKEWSNVITWMPHGRAFKIIIPKRLEQLNILPTYFGHCRFSSFLRQLSNHGFRHLTQGVDRNCYYHEFMLRGMPHLCKYMPEGRDARRLVPDPENEPDFYKISELFPLNDAQQAKMIKARTHDTDNHASIEVCDSKRSGHPTLNSGFVVPTYTQGLASVPDIDGGLNFPTAQVPTSTTTRPLPEMTQVPMPKAASMAAVASMPMQEIASAAPVPIPEVASVAPVAIPDVASVGQVRMPEVVPIVPPMANATLPSDLGGSAGSNTNVEWNYSLQNQAPTTIDPSFQLQFNLMQQQQQQQQFQAAATQQAPPSSQPEPPGTQTSQMMKWAALQQILKSQNCHQLQSCMKLS